MRVITSEQVKTALELVDFVEPMGRALAAYSRGDVLAAPMSLFEVPGGETHIKAAVLRGGSRWSVKVVTNVPANAARGLPAAHATVTLFDVDSGQPVVLIQDDGGRLTGWRTAAVGAISAQLLAPPTRTLLVAGTGQQARLQVQAFASVQEFSRLLIWGRRADAVGRMAAELRMMLPQVDVVAVSDLERAVAEAQSVITATSSTEPFLRGEWLRPGHHVTALGADDLAKRELDATAFGRADRVYVDSIAQNLEVGELHDAVDAGVLDAGSLVELGTLWMNPVRRKPDEITIAKLTGIGVQDLAAAEVVLERVP
ncbi:ornithine cyclodeaminase family protein [Nonomuraea sp. NPDC050202]|uniref:ornithine cyclodeaminase family protein n=1 Tax=Nonomuraea sp. NPDC050202 TaxID=3155035 RepID=UPI0033DF49A1